MLSKRFIRLSFLFLFFFTQISCRKLATVKAPVTSINGFNVYTNDATAIAVLTGLYTYMSQPIQPFATGVNSISIQAGLSADELVLWSGSTSLNFRAQYQNSLSNTVYPPFWASLYYFLHTINSAIEGLSNSNSLTPAVKKQLLGEAQFMRAFCNFYLVNLYGDIPLVTTSNYEVNATLPRKSSMDVYKQIIDDLHDAQGLLSDNYLDAALSNPAKERIRPIKWAATALLARAYLFTSNWSGADSAATVVINNSLYSLSPLTGPASVFNKNSSEAIWQLQPVNSGWNTEDARTFAITPAGPNTVNPVYLSSFILNSFESGDQRFTNWINSRMVGTNTYFCPFKYKISTSGTTVSEYLMVLRLAEQYLIRSEARAQQNNILAAASDLDMVRKRAGLSNTTANSQPSLLTAILRERQVELFTEWGHRWLDLKRTGNVNSIMSGVTSQKGGSWSTNWQLYPIPMNDLQSDYNIVQNIGY